MFRLVPLRTPRKDEMTPAARPISTRAAILAGIAILALLSLAVAARAARDPIAAGSTDLHFKKGFLRKLGNLQIGVVPVGAGSASGNKVGLTVRDGKLDPTDSQGFLDSRGGFNLTRGERGVPLTQLTVNTV